ncbi:DUF2617 family protein [Marinitenerispora sediminis]|uniref:DUF2617 domain-containing protein n=1 Tax=Marinitenerispora sediminis TaxID=1931232 RepID=A0A368T2W8_9ACTN|nr:DUF2617 family protein [Marinitenerispora sediminis]RCV49183.1 DUF2617 domain-containing protein [Marinitenerispora sediminis]RCV51994.1 DUF2617 domain-containing protein [Marinitenerispora sediminis]RCV56053.1 DUF2617 domain-containing protein [Marinitenerispora sediminis]
MRATCRTPFVDTRAGDLTWTLGHPPTEPLAVRTVTVAGHRVELRVLGASHQVLLYGAHGLRLVETVACLPGALTGLPDRASPEVADLAGYTFDHHVAVLGPRAFAERVDRVHAEVAAAPGGLVAGFPGSPHAVTALLVRRSGPRGLAWRTWHAYPQAGELVATATSIVLPRSAGAGRAAASTPPAGRPQGKDHQ